MSLKEIRKSTKYTKLQNILENAQQKLNLEQDLKEAFALHASLRVRQMYGKNKYNPKLIMKCVAQVQSNRSRITTLVAKASVHLSYVEEASKAFRIFLYTEYSEDMKKYKTKEQKDAIFQRIVGSVSDFISEGNAFIKHMEYLIKDLDQSSHSLRHMIDILKILQGAKGTNIV